jgi:hypothetical protein
MARRALRTLAVEVLQLLPFAQPLQQASSFASFSIARLQLLDTAPAKGPEIAILNKVLTE